MNNQTISSADGTAAMWAAFRWVEQLLTALVKEAEPQEEKTSSWLPWRGLRLGRERPEPAGPGRWPALEALARKFRLSPFECDVLLLTAAVDLNPALADLCAEVEPMSNRPFPTLSLAFRLFDKARTAPESK